MSVEAKPLMETIRPGDKLPNGAILLDKSLVRDDEWIVLALHGGAGAVHPFCSWVASSDGVTSWGDYSADMERAVMKYYARTRERARS